MQRTVIKGAGVMVRQGRQRREVRDPELRATVVRAFGLYQKIRELELQFYEAREVIAGRAEDALGGCGTVEFEAEGVSCTVSCRREITISAQNASRVREALGRKFSSLVRSSTRYTGRMGILQQAGPGLRRLLDIKELSPQFRWESKRGAKARSGGK